MQSGSIILFPLFAMMLLVTFVAVLLGLSRISAIKSKIVSIKFYRSYTGDEPEYNKVVSRHYSNLFEMPVLFYLVIVLIYITRQATLWMVELAWAYVASRYVHSLIHLTSNNVKMRFSAFTISVTILVTMWIFLLARLLNV